ncbi:hypothetical protein HK405_009123 [Cladochytrium tenue]|nr:hypothetical protein HK405_009123 [Cladochytrium tenue]
MLVKIRLSRWGARNNPFYGIVVANRQAPRDNKFLDVIGTYNPVPDDAGVKSVMLNWERAKYWLGNGAQPTDRVAWILAKVGIRLTRVVKPSVLGMQISLALPIDVTLVLFLTLDHVKQANLMPLTPKQLQRQGVLSLSDEKTWSVKLTEKSREGLVTQTLPPDEARKRLKGLPEERFLPADPVPHVLGVPRGRIKLDGTPPAEALTPSEILTVLKTFTGIR